MKRIAKRGRAVLVLTFLIFCIFLIGKRVISSKQGIIQIQNYSEGMASAEGYNSISADTGQTPQIIVIKLRNFDKEVVIEEGFLKYLKVMESLAVQNNLQILVQQSFRMAEMPMAGNIVPPDTRSNHLVGHAIDINISLDGQSFNSSRLGNYEKLPKAIKNFILGCENAGMRWGGHFTPIDPVHFDDWINDKNPNWYDKWISNLQQSFKQLYMKQEPQEKTLPGVLPQSP
jgi:hypothetical protein